MAIVKLSHFIAAGGMSWGRAEEIDEAVQNWIRHERPSKDRDWKIKLFQVDESAYIDEMGALYTKRGVAPIKLGEVTLTSKYLTKLDDVEGDFEELLLDVKEKDDIEARYDGIDFPDAVDEPPAAA